jgi:hypothetical protein
MEFFRLIRLLAWGEFDKSGNIGHRFTRKCDLMQGEIVNSPLFEIARVLVRFDHVARLIINASLAPILYRFQPALAQEIM